VTLQLRPHDRPRRRLREVGAPYLSTPELLATVLTGMKAGEAVELGYRLMARFGSLAELAQASLADLCQVPGVGQARACQILAALELGRRRQTDGQEEQPVVRCPADAARLLQPHADLANQIGQEEIHALLLGGRNQVIGQWMVYRGMVNASPFHPADLLREAVRRGAVSILIGHNHPSGHVDPSPEDLRLTRELQRACDVVEIELVDHLVLGHNGKFASLKELGHLQRGFEA